MQLVPIVLTNVKTVSNTYGEPTNEKDVTVKQTTEAVDTVTINTLYNLNLHSATDSILIKNKSNSANIFYTLEDNK